MIRMRFSGPAPPPAPVSVDNGSVSAGGSWSARHASSGAGPAASSPEPRGRSLTPETRGAGSRRAPSADRQLLGAGCGGAGRGGRGADVAWRERLLEQKLEICALTVLHVIDMPRTRGRILDSVHQVCKALGCIDVARL